MLNSTRNVKFIKGENSQCLSPLFVFYDGPRTKVSISYVKIYLVNYDQGGKVTL